MNKDFSKLEEQAKKAENQFNSDNNFSASANESEKPLSKEEEIENLKNLEENIEQISDNLRRTEEEWRTKDKSKAEQLERLGMGVGLATGKNKKKSNISHSAVSSIKGFNKIETEKSDGMVGKNLDSIRDLTDNLVILDIDDNSFFEIKSINKTVKEDTDFWDSFDADRVSKKLKPKIIDTIEQLETNNNRHSKSIASDKSIINESLDREFNRGKESSSRFKSSASSSSNSRNQAEDKSARFNKFDSNDRRNASNRNKETTSLDLNKKFAGAKSISSAQLFGTTTERDDYESKNTINRFQGSDSISSDQYFNRETQNKRNSYTDAISSANLYDIKEGVRDGVTKVAGKLSSFASDVWTKYSQNY